MEPYRPNEPFIKMKLNGSLLDRMVEAGIPLTRAIQYFRDNPEGSALETLKLAAEDVVPFYGNYRNNGDWSDYAKEAVLLGMPMPKGNMKPKVNKELTNSINASLLRQAEAEQALNPMKADRLRELAEEKPLEYNLQNRNDVTHLNHDLATYQGDVIYGQDLGRNYQSNMPLPSEIATRYNDVVQSKPYQYDYPTFTQWERNFNEMDPIVRSREGFIQDLVNEYYTPSKWSGNYKEMIDRITTEPTNSYQFTENQIRKNALESGFTKADIDRMIERDFPISEIGLYTKKLRERGLEAEAANLETKYKQVPEVLKSDMSNAEKVSQLKLIANDINAEIEMMELLDQ